MDANSHLGAITADALDASVVIETFNYLEGTTIESVGRAIRAALNIAPSRKTEVIVAEVSGDRALRNMLAAEFPRVHLLDAAGLGYDEAKALAAEHARGRYVVYLDCDCLPQTGWFERITAPLRSGEAAAAGGFAAYPGGFFAATQSLMDFGFLLPRADRPLGCYASNNSAFVREVLLRIPEPDGPMRCRCYAHAQMLARAGAPVIMAGDARVTHERPPFWHERLRQGYDMVAACRVDPLLREARWLRHGIAALPLYYGRRVRLDWRTLRDFQEEIGLSRARAFAAYPFVALMRLIDAAGMAGALAFGAKARRWFDPTHNRRSGESPLGSEAIGNAASVSALVRPECASAAPRVSAIIPVHNGAATISRAVASALSQDFGPIEVIVADDGSTDSTPEALARFGHAISVLTLPKGGPAAARNAAVAASHGEYVAFLDADDAWMPSKIHVLAQALDRDRLAPLAFSDLIPMDDDGDPIADSLMPAQCAHAPAMEEMLARWWPILPSAVMMRREAFDACGGFDAAFERPGYEDPLMWMLARERGAFVYVDRPLVFYRATPFLDRMEKYARGFRIFSGRVRAHFGAAGDSLVRELVGAHVSALGHEGVMAMAAGDMRRARRAFRCALRYSPRHTRSAARLMRTFLPPGIAAALSGSALRNARAAAPLRRGELQPEA
jgi:glycosyltransferase involved in cell wall biosynthesis